MSSSRTDEDDDDGTKGRGRKRSHRTTTIIHLRHHEPVLLLNTSLAVAYVILKRTPWGRQSHVTPTQPLGNDF